jgi:hypothetical protein
MRPRNETLAVPISVPRLFYPPHPLDLPDASAEIQTIVQSAAWRSSLQTPVDGSNPEPIA